MLVEQWKTIFSLFKQITHQRVATLKARRQNGLCWAIEAFAVVIGDLIHRLRRDDRINRGVQEQLHVLFEHIGAHALERVGREGDAQVRGPQVPWTALIKTEPAFRVSLDDKRRRCHFRIRQRR